MLKIEKSFKTVVLKSNNIFVSSFAGKVVFGEVFNQGYIPLKYFVIFHFQIYNFYLSLLDIIKFISSPELKEEKGLIIQSSEEVIYFWKGITVNKQNNDIKLILIGIEYRSGIIYELSFETEGLNDLIKSFVDSIFSCLCLKAIERDFFEYISDQSTSLVVSLKCSKNIKKILSEFEEKIENNILCDLIRSNLCEITVYYNEILIIVQKLKTLHNSELQKLNDERRISAL